MYVYIYIYIWYSPRYHDHFVAKYIFFQNFTKLQLRSSFILEIWQGTQICQQNCPNCPNFFIMGQFPIFKNIFFILKKYVHMFCFFDEKCFCCWYFTLKKVYWPFFQSFSNNKKWPFMTFFDLLNPFMTSKYYET